MNFIFSFASERRAHVKKFLRKFDHRKILIDRPAVMLKLIFSIVSKILAFCCLPTCLHVTLLLVGMGWSDDAYACLCI